LLRNEQMPDLHSTREGYHLLALLQGKYRRIRPIRVLLRTATLSRWFRRRYGQAVDDLIGQPYCAALAQFIKECECVAPGSEQVVANVSEALYEFGTGANSVQEEQAMVLLTAHRAKGLEFDHVLILDGGGWADGSDEERRLFYVAITRARKTLTLCERLGQQSQHAFVRDCNGLSLRSRPSVQAADYQLFQRIWVADPKQVVLSWPGYFSPKAPIHWAIANLDYGSELVLRQKTDGKEGWEIADKNGIAVTRMAKQFMPPQGEIIGVKVAAILVRHATDKDFDAIKCTNWEVVLPEIVYLPDTGI
jgi:ATP-dependent DNA helicase RecQ